MKERPDYGLVYARNKSDDFDLAASRPLTRENEVVEGVNAWRHRWYNCLKRQKLSIRISAARI